MRVIVNLLISLDRLTSLMIKPLLFVLLVNLNYFLYKLLESI